MIDIPGNALAFIFALGIIIFVHGSGHYLAAKGFGMRVLTFSLGFGKRLWGFQRGETEYRLIHRGLDFRPGLTVLDVGCGTGWFTRRVAADGARVVGLDRDAESLTVARQRDVASSQYVHGDACRLPFADASFDAVIAITSLCFVPA